MIQSNTTVRQNMGRTLWLLAMELMVEILSNADSRRRCARDGFEKVESNGWGGNCVWIQDDTERYYHQSEYRKNILLISGSRQPR